MAFRFKNMARYVRNVLDPLIQANRHNTDAKLDQFNRYLQAQLDQIRDEFAAYRAATDATITQQQKVINNIPVVQVGWVLIWPIASTPPDVELYLKCDGSQFSPAKYPELYKLFPNGRTPNYSGVFLRGHGTQVSHHFGDTQHTSDGLGVLQGDTFRSGAASGEVECFCAGSIVRKSGVFSKSYTISRSRDQCGWSNSPNGVIKFDMSGSVPVSNEIRPVNIAVQYWIRALERLPLSDSDAA